MRWLLALWLTFTPVGLGVERVATAVEHPKPTVRELRTPEYAKRVTWRVSRSMGMSNRQIRCLKAIWQAESNFRPNAFNKTPVKTATGPKHAGGIPQVLGLNPKSPVEHQVRRGLAYIEHRYGTPCNALAYWVQHHSY